MTRYAKGVEGVKHFYQPEDLFKYAGEPFDVRVSILDEPPDGSLWATVDGEYIGKPIGELLDEFVIGSETKQTEFIRDKILELDEFPHLSDALDWISDIWHRFREGDADVTLCINNGPDDITLQDTAREHMSTCKWDDGAYDYMLLDLVLEPGEMTLTGMLGERKQEFQLWMKGFLALYKLDLDPAAEKLIRKRDDLEDAREQLLFHNLIEKDSKGKLSITQQGRKGIGRLIAEQEDLIERFDVFRDVAIRKRDDSFSAEFGTLSGADYRIAVYKHEGIDPFRAVFILTLLSGELDDDLTGKKWLELINDDRFYEGLLAPVIDFSQMKSEELQELVAQGQQYLARTQAQRQRAGYSQGVLARAQVVQAFARPSKKKKNGSEKEKGFKKASETKPSDDLGDPPAEVEAEEKIEKASAPQATKSRSTRSFKKLSVKKPPQDDEDDGWL